MKTLILFTVLFMMLPALANDEYPNEVTSGGPVTVEPTSTGAPATKASAGELEEAQIVHPRCKTLDQYISGSRQAGPGYGTYDMIPKWEAEKTKLNCP